MPTATKRRPRTRTDQLLTTQNEILELLRQDVTEWQRSGERIDRQHRANLQALVAIARGQKDVAEMLKISMQSQQAIMHSQEVVVQSQERITAILREVQAITARVLEQSNQVLLRLGGNGSSH
jgi:ATP-dependent 26S proteasome regulatory subunit